MEKLEEKIPHDVQMYKAETPGMQYCSVALDASIRTHAKEYRCDYIAAMASVTGYSLPLESDVLSSDRRIES